MSRWRPPQPRSTAVITPQGYIDLEKELKNLWAKRRIVNDALAAAAAEGDRSENAEYIYRKKEQAGIDRRIRYLQKRMPDLKVVDSVGNKNQIFFGATIELEKETIELEDTEKKSADSISVETVKYRIVGPDETDAKRNFISIDSPLAKALLKKEVDDEIKLEINDTETYYTVNSIKY